MDWVKTSGATMYERKETKAILKGAIRAFDDWIVTYAPEFCEQDRVEAAEARIRDAGSVERYARDHAGNLHTLTGIDSDLPDSDYKRLCLEASDILYDWPILLPQYTDNLERKREASDKMIEAGGTLAVLSELRGELQAILNHVNSIRRIEMQIKVTPQDNPDRIEGLCRIPGWAGGLHSVISLIRRNDEWTVGSSMALPVKMDQAKVVKECYDMAFEKLEELTK